MLRFALLGAGALLIGCPGPSGDLYEIQVQPLVDGAPFSCSTPLTNLGTTGATRSAKDFRLYLHDVQLIEADGTRVDLELEDDDAFQGDDVVLLDFADGTGDCDDANGTTNDLVIGYAPEGTAPVGVEFRVGMPPELNHLDAATAEPPLNDTGMWWTWSGGFKWVRLELLDDADEPFYFHHGATGCDGSPNDGFDCAYQNDTRIVVDTFDPDTQMLAMDVSALFAGNDFDAPVDFGAGDFVKGCMAFSGDPECQPIFEALGINFEDTNPGPSQVVFSAL